MPATESRDFGPEIEEIKGDLGEGLRYLFATRAVAEAYRKAQLARAEETRTRRPARDLEGFIATGLFDEPEPEPEQSLEGSALELREMARKLKEKAAGQASGSINSTLSAESKYKKTRKGKKTKRKKNKYKKTKRKKNKYKKTKKKENK